MCFLLGTPFQRTLPIDPVSLVGPLSRTSSRPQHLWGLVRTCLRWSTRPSFGDDIRLTEAFTGVLSCKNVVASSGSVHFPLGADVKHFALDCDIDGLRGILAIECAQLRQRYGVVLGRQPEYTSKEPHLWRSELSGWCRHD